MFGAFMNSNTMERKIFSLACGATRAETLSEFALESEARVPVAKHHGGEATQPAAKPADS